MATIDLVTSSVIEATGWVGATVANLEASNNLYATDGNKDEFIRVELTDAPGDFGSLNSVILKVEASTTVTPTRTRQIQLQLLDSANNVLETFLTPAITLATDTLFTSTVFTRADALSVVNGYRLLATVIEGGGMADAATMTIDWMAVELDYNAAAQTINMDPGAYTFSGHDAALTRSLLANMDVGGIAFDGLDSSLTRSLNANMDVGSLALSGFSADMMRSLLINPDVGVLSLSGLEASFVRSLILDMDAGVLNFSGLDNDLIRSIAAQMDTGNITLTGHDLSLVRSLFMHMDAGNFALTGLDANISQSLIMNMDVGSLAFSGLDATFAEQGMHLVTRGYGTGTLVGEIPLVVLRGYRAASGPATSYTPHMII